MRKLYKFETGGCQISHNFLFPSGAEQSFRLHAILLQFNELTISMDDGRVLKRTFKIHLVKYTLQK